MPHPVETNNRDDAERSALLRLPAVVRMTGLARSTIYKHVALQQFPSPVSLVGRAVGWRLAEIEDWAQRRPRAGSLTAKASDSRS
jgi:prophage regulatory protein